VVRLGNGVDDGKAKPEAVAPAVTRGCQSLERLEEPLDLVAGDNWPAVGDGKGRNCPAGLGGDLYVSVRVVVTDGVVDQVGDEALANWLTRVTPAAAFAVQQTLVPYHQVASIYTPYNGYYPLEPWAGFAVLAGYAAAALAVAAVLLRRRDA